MTNGEAEEKLENGESTPAPEEGKKPKKEKVCNLYSLLILKLNVPSIQIV